MESKGISWSRLRSLAVPAVVVVIALWAAFTALQEPDLPVFDQDEWVIYGNRSWTVRVHVQEIGENGLDMPHFKTVHSADIPQMVRAEGID